MCIRDSILKGDKRICNGKADCLKAIDEENCDAFQIETECTEEVCSNFQSKTFSLTPLERNGPRKGGFREDGLVCEDNNGAWVFLGYDAPERCDNLKNKCASGLDEINCTDLLGKVPIFIALGIFVASLLAFMLREACHEYKGDTTQKSVDQFLKERRTTIDEAIDAIIDAAQKKAGERGDSTGPDLPDLRENTDLLEAAFSQVHEF